MNTKNTEERANSLQAAKEVHKTDDVFASDNALRTAYGWIREVHIVGLMAGYAAEQAVWCQEEGTWLSVQDAFDCAIEEITLIDQGDMRKLRHILNAAIEATLAYETRRRRYAAKKTEAANNG